MEQAEQRARLLNYAYFYLKFRPRSKEELSRYLAKKLSRLGGPETLVDTVVSQLEQEGLVDDRSFIDWLVRSRSVCHPKGSFAIKGELRRFGVAQELVDAYFSRHPVNEQAGADRLLRARWCRLAGLPEPKRWQRAVALLVRRGFDFSVARQAYKNAVAFAKSQEKG
ncbi:RecX family transcriptional regulator [Patescibacteria group bacterium]|nr:RecX family transcriptional regulator [Patescibacteria group bacterium]